MTLGDGGIVICLLILDLLVLRLHNVDLGVKDKLVSDYLKLFLIELLNGSIVVPAHLLILLLQERDVLEAGLLVVEERTDARLLLIVNDLLFQDLKLKLHEVNLLLEI